MINIFAVIVSIVVYWILGAIWFSAKVFGKPWTKALRRNIEDLGPGIKQMLGSFLANVIVVIVLALILEFIGSYDVVTALLIALLVGVGFVVPTDFYDVIFEDKNMIAFLIDVGYHFLGIIIVGLILGLWKI
ncbi:MAG: DUF1761 domain-containing protein [Promethearchaeota archaeon]|nr:MAG: DUF1761 domain-containing protein [Candidatus Lokiarchaeota archaeon]